MRVRRIVKDGTLCSAVTTYDDLTKGKIDNEQFKSEADYNMHCTVRRNGSLLGSQTHVPDGAR